MYNSVIRLPNFYSSSIVLNLFDFEPKNILKSFLNFSDFEH